jgi:hypothetical protein
MEHVGDPVQNDRVEAAVGEGYFENAPEATCGGVALEDGFEVPP